MFFALRRGDIPDRWSASHTYIFPNPAIIVWSNKTDFIGDCFLLIFCRKAEALNALLNGSGPRAANDGYSARFFNGTMSTKPNLLGSLYLIKNPSSVLKVRWSWASLTFGESLVIRTRPDMPKCKIITISSCVCQRIYFPRLSNFNTRAPVKTCSNDAGIGQRRSGLVFSTLTIFRPTRKGLRPRLTVSTSGNSGIVSFSSN